jgi:predicted nucleic acid-binding protein
MMLVVDANILFSALIKNSVTAKLLFEESFNLCTPEFIIEEFFKYEAMLIKKTSRTKEEFIQIMHALKEVITVVPKEEYSKLMKEAEAISPDKKDALYFALALKLRCGIWTNDKRLQGQKKVKIYSTRDVMQLI